MVLIFFPNMIPPYSIFCLVVGIGERGRFCSFSPPPLSFSSWFSLSALVPGYLPRDGAPQVSIERLPLITSPDYQPLPALQACAPINDTACVTVVYSAPPDLESAADTIFQALASDLNLTFHGQCSTLDFTNPNASYGVCSLPSGTQSSPTDVVSDFFESRVTALFPLGVALPSSDPSQSLDPFLQGTELFYNGSGDTADNMTQLVTAYTSALITAAGGQKPELNLRRGYFPQPDAVLPSSNLYQVAANFFLLIPPSLLLVFCVTDFVYEKEHEIRRGLNMVGLKDTAYLFSVWFFWSMIGLVASLLIYLLGLIIGIPIMTRCNFFVVILMFWLSAMAHVSLALLFAVFPRKTRTASNIGFAYLILILFVAAFISPSFIYLWWYEGLVAIDVIRVLLYFLPAFHFSKVLADITYVVTSPDDDAFFSFGDLYKAPEFGLVASVPVPNDALLMLLALTAGYGLIAWYLDAVYDSVSRSRRNVLFFLSPRYWGFRRTWAERLGFSGGVGGCIPFTTPDPTCGILAQVTPGDPLSAVDPTLLGLSPEEDHSDVIAEAQRAFVAPENAAAIRVQNLSVTYRSLVPWRKSHRAVQGISFAVPPRTCFSLLGHNGAGKTTTLGAMIGLLPPTSGRIEIFGLDTATHIDQIQEWLGVCPQFEVVWPYLTGREHLKFFARFRGVPHKQAKSTVDQLLEAVGLTYAANRRSRTYSGGMRRRLALAIAMIAEPRLIFLDEPSSGLDVSNRRKVWDLILRLKRVSLVVLVSHAIKEVETLADTIMIMAEGRAKAFGTSLRLKNQWGRGYRLLIEAASLEAVEAANTLVLSIIPDGSADLLETQGNQLIYQVPSQYLDKLSALFSQIDDLMEAPPHGAAGAGLGVGHDTPGGPSTSSKGGSQQEYTQTSTNLRHSDVQACPIVSYSISISSLEEVFLRTFEADSEDGDEYVPDEDSDHHGP